LITSAFPKISAVELTDDATVTLTGTDFIKDGYTADVKIAGVSANSVTLVSATSATAKWVLGVPTTAESLPSFRFENTNGE
jgi:hypothetical protein